MNPRHSSTQRRRRLVTVVALATGLALAALVIWWVSPEGSNPPLTAPVPSGEASPIDAPSPTASPGAETLTTAEPATAEGTIPSRLPSAVDLPGLSGDSLSRDVPPLALTITVTSSSPIGTVGWVIPMSKEKSSGQAGGVGRSWSLSTTVYGKPDYARVFLQAGSTGDPVTCVIKVNGTVTERRSTVGPYGALMCQG